MILDDLVPAAMLRKIPWNDLRLFMHHNGIYLIPTEELIQFIQELIVPQGTIEIGCGLGVLGKALSIPTTDSMIQNEPSVAAWYAAMQQPTIKYPSHVEKLEALAALDKYHPEVVIGSWITRWISPSLEPPADGGGGSIYGVREDLLIPRVKRYVHIGSEAVHGYKLQYNPPPTRIVRPDWLVSRSDRNDDVIYIWENP